MLQTLFTTTRASRYWQRGIGRLLPALERLTESLPDCSAQGILPTGSIPSPVKYRHSAMSTLGLLLLVVILVWYWQTGMNCRDIAIAAARNTCAREGLQLLDGTVSLRNIRPFFGDNRQFGLLRTFGFEYSDDGLSRLSGCIVLRNKRVESIILEGY